MPGWWLRWIFPRLVAVSRSKSLRFPVGLLLPPPPLVRHVPELMDQAFATSRGRLPLGASGSGFSCPCSSLPPLVLSPRTLWLIGFVRAFWPLPRRLVSLLRRLPVLMHCGPWPLPWPSIPTVRSWTSSGVVPGLLTLPSPPTTCGFCWRSCWRWRSSWRPPPVGYGAASGALYGAPYGYGENPGAPPPGVRFGAPAADLPAPLRDLPGAALPSDSDDSIPLLHPLVRLAWVADTLDLPSPGRSVSKSKSLRFDEAGDTAPQRLLLPPPPFVRQVPALLDQAFAAVSLTGPLSRPGISAASLPITDLLFSGCASCAGS